MMLKTNFSLRLCFIIGVFLGGLTACANQAQPAAPTLAPTPTPVVPTGRGAGDTLRILFWQAPTILNPHLASSQKDWAPARITYEPLASFDKDGNLVPILAAQIPSLENGGVAADGKSVTWKLRANVQWSDGVPFTAADVKFTYDFIANHDVNGATTFTNYQSIKDVKVEDDLTVRIDFQDVNPAWAVPFVGVQGMIIPRHVFEPYNNANAANAPANLLPVGTGPYRVVRFKPEEVLFLGNTLVETNKIIYEPNPYFREPDKPYFSRIELKGGGTVNEAARAVLQAGDVDYATNLQINFQEQPDLAQGSKGQILAPFGAFVERILLNRTDPNRETDDGERSSIQFPHPFFTDLRVRQAFAYAIDRTAIAQLYGPTGQPTTNVLVSPPPFESPNTQKQYPFDPAKAARLLDEAGWKDTNSDGIRDNGEIRKPNEPLITMRVLLQTSASPIRQQTQEIIKRTLSAIQVDVQLTFFDSITFFSSDPTITNTRHHFYADMEMYSTGNRSPDPGSYMRNWICSEMAQKANSWKGLNKERWCSPAYDTLYQVSTAEIDPAQRRQLFIEMNDRLIDDVVVIPLVRQADISGVSNTLIGVDLSPWDADLWNIKDWKRGTP
jgi:peptide/nickel transport system substrate-binding protein